MKYLYLSFFILICSVALSQSPEAFKYQAVVRDHNGQIISGEVISIKISILQGSINGSSVYTETHTTETNAFGSVNLEIGKGAVKSGSFSAITWGAQMHFVKIEMDINADNVYEHMGTTQLLSVPYALFAQKSGDEKWSFTGNDIFYNKGKVGIGADTPLEALHINGNIRGNQQGGALRVKTDYGYLDVGAKNPDYAHFYTSMPYGFYFGGGPVTVNEQLIGYKATDLHISTQSNANFQPVKRISILNANGYVGINKTNPQYNLDVNGTLNATAIYINGTLLTPGGAAASVWLQSGNNAYYNTGNVGIGTTSPAEALHINGNVRGGQQGGALRVKTDYGYLDVGAKNPDYAHFYTEMPYGFYFGGGPVTVNEQLIGYKASDLHLSTQSNINYQPVKRISILNANGFVGIGTTQPKSQLQVESGDIYLKDANAGVIMKSPDQQCWRLTVSNAGAPVFVSVTCPD